MDALQARCGSIGPIHFVQTPGLGSEDVASEGPKGRVGWGPRREGISGQVFASAPGIPSVRRFPELKVGLAFSELGTFDVGHFLAKAAALDEKPDLLVLPEGAFDVRLTPEQEPSTRDHILASPEFRDRHRQLQAFADTHGTTLVMGLDVHALPEGTEVDGNWAAYDAWGLVVQPHCEPRLYHKHTSSKFTAFQEDEWSAEANLPVFEVGGVKVGFTLCHDMFMSPLQRNLVDRGAQLLVNPSYVDVRDHQWEKMLQGQASTQDVPIVCPLSRSSSDAKSAQKQIFAYAPEGRVTLRDMETGTDQHGIRVADRAGRLYGFNLGDFNVGRAFAPKVNNRAKPADTGRLGHDLKLHCETAMVPIEVDFQTFASRPDVLWKLALEHREQGLPLFVIRGGLEGPARGKLFQKIAPARVTEFGNLAVLMAADGKTIEAGAFRSSNYKDVRFVSEMGPEGLRFDERFLKGPRVGLELTKNKAGPSDLRRTEARLLTLTGTGPAEPEVRSKRDRRAV